MESDKPKLFFISNVKATYAISIEYHSCDTLYSFRDCDAAIKKFNLYFIAASLYVTVKHSLFHIAYSGLSTAVTVATAH